MTDMNMSTHRVAWVSLYHPHPPSSPKDRASRGFKNASEEDLYCEQPGSPGRGNCYLWFGGGCLGDDTGRRDDRGRPPASVSTEATSTCLPAGKVRRGCPGVLRVLKTYQPTRIASLLSTTPPSTSSARLPPNCWKVPPYPHPSQSHHPPSYPPSGAQVSIFCRDVSFC